MVRVHGIELIGLRSPMEIGVCGVVCGVWYVVCGVWYVVCGVSGLDWLSQLGLDSAVADV